MHHTPHTADARAHRATTRSHRPVWRRVGAIIAVPAVALAACADGDDEPSATTAPVTTDDTTTDDTTTDDTTTDTMTDDTMTDTLTDDTMTDDTMTDDTMTDDTMTDTMTDDTTTGQDDDLLSALGGTGAEIFRTLLPIVGLDEVTDAEQVTIFVPADEAFESLESDELTSLLEDPGRVLEILQAHVVEGVFTSEDLQDGDTVIAITGDELPVTVAGDTVTIGQATVTRADVTFDGGVLHLIDDVLLL